MSAFHQGRRSCEPGFDIAAKIVVVIIWINGTFGAGKTTAARAVAQTLPQARVFDSEMVGLMLRHVLGSVPVRDFQDWPPWRGLVVEAASQILRYVGGTLVVPQSVLVEQYWSEIKSGLDEADIPVVHCVLDASPEALVQRIETDTVEVGARQWRLDHLPDYAVALPWLRREADLVVDTTRLSPVEVADAVVGGVGRPTLSE